MSQEQNNITKFYVGGMACAFCASTIEKGLKKIEGVNEVKVVLESSEVFVKYDNSLVSSEIIKKEIEKLGYYVSDRSLFSDELLKDSRRRSIISWSLTTLLGLLYFFEYYNIIFRVTIILLVTTNLFYIALPIYKGASHAIGKGILNEHVLYGVAGISSYILGIVGFLEFNKNLFGFLFISSLLTSLHLSAGWMGAILNNKVEKALHKVIELRPPYAHLINGEDVPVTKLKKGDIVIVKPGEKIPLDGVVVDGESEVSEAIITGESEPVSKGKGDFVIGGSTNGSGYLKVKITEDYNNSYLSKIIGLVNYSKQKKSAILTFFDKVIDKIWVPLALAISIITVIAWGLYGILIGKDLWLYGIINGLLVSTIAYPCAIGFSSPSMALSLYEKMLHKGMIIKNSNVYEKIKEIDTIIFDKTGTLTYGTPIVTQFIGDSLSLAYAASVEALSSHPIAKAIVKYAKEQGVKILEVKDFKEISGIGVRGKISDKIIEVKKAENNNDIAVYINGEPIASFNISDVPRPNLKDYLEKLKNEGLKIIILSGDKEDKVKELSKELNIQEYYSNLSPEDKVRIIEKLKQNGNKVLMIGDGVNDAAALALADVSVAMGNGVDISKNVADIILVSNDIGTLLGLIKNRKRLSNAIPSNVILALTYNGIGIPLAIFGILTMKFAMIIMILSLFSIFINSRVFVNIIGFD
ncbi:cadmium-translocating P-type ATPase [Saccharolobus solfataricus]|nr:cation-translocating P-type ATPase [Saccharolobus solfataricus]AKA73068.1 cadmium-translocating P-type ATPase [Saccharolobus solfataricus]AKA75766.1 cadmium-translocating P-type ATPase [Saccharolobus solfataricus]AKA78458.1 cadmium-translocating P-type ATPase [Saccharolobus solfataricus]AZF67576.1 cadmium-translocating P-type ATPase [Saccharolobus solfataricus]AZF70196.1 cadmium-translocating P-type ATPase [Saccharolobus solfataricus]